VNTAAERLGRAFLAGARQAEEARWFTTGEFVSADPATAIVDDTQVLLTGYVGTLPEPGEPCVIGILRAMAGVQYVLIGGAAAEVAEQFCVAGVPITFEPVDAFVGLGTYVVTVSGHDGQSVGVITGTFNATITPLPGFLPNVFIRLTPPAPFDGDTHSFGPFSVAGGEGDQEWTLDLSGSEIPIDGSWTLRIISSSGAAESGTLYKLCIALASFVWPPPGTAFTSSPNLALPDRVGGVDGVATDTIEVAGLGSAGHAGVHLGADIPHTYPSDLTVELIDPDGNEAVVYAAGDPEQYEFDDGVSTGLRIRTIDPMAVPAPGPDGTWTLRITDSGAADVGTLDSWTLIFPD
jgi:subtilisin-like proprotein convertase family protein